MACPPSGAFRLVKLQCGTPLLFWISLFRPTLGTTTRVSSFGERDLLHSLFTPCSSLWINNKSNFFSRQLWSKSGHQVGRTNQGGGVGVQCRKFRNHDQLSQVEDVSLTFGPEGGEQVFLSRNVSKLPCLLFPDTCELCQQQFSI